MKWIVRKSIALKAFALKAKTLKEIWLPRLLVSTLIIFISSGAVQAAEIGKVILATGEPIIQRADTSIPAKRHAVLFEQDTLITPNNSKLLIRLTDKTTISLAPQTEFVLSEYQYSDTKSAVRFKMLKGAFRTITGEIGKHKQPLFEITTPIATIGVRGTDYWAGDIFSTNTEKSLGGTMFKGKGVYVINDLGQVELKTAKSGTTVKAGQAPGTVQIWADEKLIKAQASTAIVEE